MPQPSCGTDLVIHILLFEKTMQKDQVSQFMSGRTSMVCNLGLLYISAVPKITGSRARLPGFKPSSIITDCVTRSK